MATVQDINAEIGRIAAAKANIIGAIEEKGVTVPEESRIEDLPQLIREIPAGKSGKIGVISQTQSWTGTPATGYDYTISDKVIGNIPQANIDLFISVGAIFNETTGYFEFNGLVDLTYTDMLKVIRYDMENQPPMDNYQINARTNLPKKTTRYYSNRFQWAGGSFNQTNDLIESIAMTEEGPLDIQQERFFFLSNDVLFCTNCNYLKRVSGIISIQNFSSIVGSFIENCFSLEEIKLYGMKGTISALAKCSRLSLNSIAFLVRYSMNTGQMTLTLHPSAYARCESDTTEYLYNGNTYIGIIAFATEKNISIVSA